MLEILLLSNWYIAIRHNHYLNHHLYQAYADGLLVIPKVLGQNAGFDSQEVIVKLLEEAGAGQQVNLQIFYPIDIYVYGMLHAKHFL